jgi:putative Mn2+ efflux pump MntP
VEFITIIFVAFALSMDAFAVSLCFGTCAKIKKSVSLRAGLFFGSFQAIMPLIGWGIGFLLKNVIQQIDHWIAFILLVFIGLKMIVEAVKSKSCQKKFDTDSLWVMLSLSIATSLDALAVGLSFALLKIPILAAVSIIGLVTFAMSYAGVYLGKRLGYRFGSKAEIAGGIILVGIGLKILLEHVCNNL